MSDSRKTISLTVFWLLSGILLVLAGTGWYIALSGRKKLRTCQQSKVEALADCDKPENREPKPGEIKKPEPGSSKKAKSKNPQTEFDDWFNNPFVQQTISKKAQKQTEKLLNKKIDEYRQERKERRISRFHGFLDTMEVGYVNAINKYIENNNLSEEEGVALHKIFSDMLKNSRSNLQKLQEGKLTRRESHRVGRQNFRDWRKNIQDALGEEAAKQLFELAKEEMRKEFQKQRDSEEQ
ncbi:MAG: hypothetical protein ACQES9_08860 [Myxococcota bacterium]